MKPFDVLRKMFTKGKHEEHPAPKPAQVSYVDHAPAEPVEDGAAPRKPELNLPRLALGILAKQVSKRYAFDLARAYYGPEGAAQLSEEIAAARKKWLVPPGTHIQASNRVYGVAPDGSWRTVRFVDGVKA